MQNPLRGERAGGTEGRWAGQREVPATLHSDWPLRGKEAWRRLAVPAGSCSPLRHLRGYGRAGGGLCWAETSTWSGRGPAPRDHVMFGCRRHGAGARRQVRDTHGSGAVPASSPPRGCARPRDGSGGCGGDNVRTCRDGDVQRGDTRCTGVCVCERGWPCTRSACVIIGCCWPCTGFGSVFVAWEQGQRCMERACTR